MVSRLRLGWPGGGKFQTLDVPVDRRVQPGTYTLTLAVEPSKGPTAPIRGDRGATVAASGMELERAPSRSVDGDGWPARRPAPAFGRSATHSWRNPPAQSPFRPMGEHALGPPR